MKTFGPSDPSGGGTLGKDRAVANLFRQQMPRPFWLASYITTDLPTLSGSGANEGALAYDDTLNKPTFFDGSAWQPLSTSTGIVTSVIVNTANGVSAVNTGSPSAIAFTFTLGAITPSSVNISSLTASQIVATDASKNLVSLAVATYPALAELAYVKGVTSAIQTQIDGKQPLDSDLTTWAGITPATGIGTFLATPSSANLATALTDETGSGKVVFGTAPTMTTITLADAAGAGNLKTNQNSGSIADNGTYDFPSQGYGLFMIVEAGATGAWALCGTDGATVKIISQSAALFTPTFDTALSVNLYYNAGTVRIQNKRGGASNFRVFNIQLN